MKRFYFLFVLLFMPMIVNAKTVTCTSENDFTVGKNVYDGISINCSEGDVEIFAVAETSNEISWNNVVNPYSAIAGKKYSIEFVWTGTFDANVDTMIVDEEDLDYMGLMICDDGCHLLSKNVEPRPAENQGTGTEKKIGVGTIYYVGDSIKFNDVSIILYTDLDGEFLEVDDGSYVLPSPQYVQDDGNGSWVWGFENFLREYDETGLSGLYFGYVTDVSADRIPIGIKCISGDGSDVENPYTFELVYEDSNTNQELNEPGDNDSETIEYTILDGANQTYILGSNTNIVIKASGDLDKLQAIEIDNGNMISSSNYQLASGSTILTLLSSFLENTSIGEHTINFRYSDGEVSTKLTIANETDNNPTPISNNTDNIDNNNPKTHDNIDLYIMIFGLSTITLTSVGIYIKRKIIS